MLTYPYMYHTTAFADSIQQIVEARNDAGDALGLDKLGCDWHPSRRDDEILADTLTEFIGAFRCAGDRHRAAAGPPPVRIRAGGGRP